MQADGKILYLSVRTGDPKCALKFSGILRFASTLGWDAEPVPIAGSRPSDVPGLLRDFRPAGCVVESSAGHDVLPPKTFGSVPAVYLDVAGDGPLWPGAPTVLCDNEAVARSAFHELSGNNPGGYAVVPYAPERRWSRIRARAFRALCAEAGKACRVFPVVRGEEDAREVRAARLVPWMAALPAGTAVFAANDRFAQEAYDAARACGRHVPRDITLLGVDGSRARAFPDVEKISTIKLDFERAGYLAARMLAGMAGTSARHGAGPAAPSVAKFGPLMVDRLSSTRGRGRHEPHIFKAVEMIRREATDGLGAAGLIARFPGTRRLFDLRFREAMGHSVLDEILHVRMEKVMALLLRPDVPIGAIASLCGFGSDIELRALFRRRFGISMRRWRMDNVR